VKRGYFLSLLLSLGLSAVLLAVLFGRVRAADLASTIARIYLPYFLAYAAISFLATWLRAWRYKALLGPVSIGWSPLLLVTLVRNAFDDLLPARVGSLSYILLLNRNLGFSFESAASSFIAALVFDFLTLAPVVALAVLAVGLGTSGFSGPLLLVTAAVFFGIVGLTAWKLVPILNFGVRVYTCALDRFGWSGKKSAVVSVEKLRATVEALRAIRWRRITGRIFGLSLLIRLCKYASLYALLLALLRSHGLGGSELSFWKIILGVTGAEMTSALPIKGLAGFGTWESAWAVAFRLMRFDAGLAVLSGMGVHLVTNMFEYGLGLTALLVLVLRLKIRRARKADGDAKTPPPS
jgi:hypothetical protein